MRGVCEKMALTTGIITGCSLDGTEPPIIIALAVITMILVIIAIGGKN